MAQILMKALGINACDATKHRYLRDGSEAESSTAA